MDNTSPRAITKAACIWSTGINSILADINAPVRSTTSRLSHPHHTWHAPVNSAGLVSSICCAANGLGRIDRLPISVNLPSAFRETPCCSLVFLKASAHTAILGGIARTWPHHNRAAWSLRRRMATSSLPRAKDAASSSPNAATVFRRLARHTHPLQSHSRPLEIGFTADTQVEASNASS